MCVIDLFVASIIHRAGPSVFIENCRFLPLSLSLAFALAHIIFALDAHI